MEFLKDPIVLGSISGLIMFIYLWKNLPQVAINDDKQQNQICDKIKRINWLLPITAALVVWFVSSCYLNNNDIFVEVQQTPQTYQSQQIPQTYQSQQNYMSKYASQKAQQLPNYNLVKKGTSKMNKIDLPDLFIEVDGYRQL